MRAVLAVSMALGLDFCKVPRLMFDPMLSF
jgi:hypothetical protein